MAQYIERDGDWVLRPPGRLYQVSMYAFILRAQHAALAALCDHFVNTPTGSAVTAAPLLGLFPFVILVCADMHGRSLHPEDRNRGYGLERDVGFFVPVTLSGAGDLQRACLLPYLYVNNFAAVLIGREIFGFPKVLGQIEFDANPLRVVLRSMALPKDGPDQPVQDACTLLSVETTQPAPSEPLPATWAESVLHIGTEVLRALGASRFAADLSGVPLLFLKQFRDAARPDLACYQSIVSTVATVETLRQASILRDQFSVTLPRYDSVHIAEQLGLEADHGLQPTAAFFFDLDFTVPCGTVLWKAP